MEETKGTLKSWDNYIEDIETVPIEFANKSPNKRAKELDWNTLSFKNMAIVGGIRTGKTALAYKITEAFPEMKKYIYKHPKPDLVESLGFESIDFGELSNLSDCLFWIDEPQLYMKLYEKKGNDALKRLLSLCGQRDIKLIITTSDTRFITRGLESYIDVWIVKDLDYDLVKNGAKIKKIIQDYSFVSTDGFKLGVDEFLFYQKGNNRSNRKWTFKQPDYFTEALSKPYKEI